MIDWLPRLVYTVLPCLVGAFSVAVFLTTRPISATRAWVLGLLIASLLTLGAVRVMGPWERVRADGSVLVSYGGLYFFPMIMLVGAALLLRSRAVSRGVGIIILVVLFLATSLIGRMVSLQGMINAVQ